MFIKYIELTNFQIHSSLSLDFTKEVNVLYGKTGAGKSCVRRAIEWCLLGAKLDGIRKEGTKQTSVCVTLDTNVEIERIRSASVNRYILRKPGEDELSFDAVGKDVPEEIRNEIGIVPIDLDGEKFYLNSSPQIALPFLFDKSPSTRMKIFNKLSGAEVLDNLFAEFNKDILRIGREQKDTEENLKKYLALQETKEVEKEKLEAVHELLQEKFQSVQTAYGRWEQLNVILRSLQENKEMTDIMKAGLCHFNIPADKLLVGLTKNVELYSKLLETFALYTENGLDGWAAQEALNSIKLPQTDAIYSITENIEKLEARKRLLDALQATQKNINQCPDLTASELPALNWQSKSIIVDRFETVRDISKELASLNRAIMCVELALNENEILLGKAEQGRKDLIKAMKICPECNQEINENCLQ